MPSATYRMHQKLSDGSYQAIHVESESGVILRPNGDTVEQTLRCCVLAEDAGDNVPGFVVDADTLGGSTKEEIISTAQAGVDLSNIDAATLGGSTKEQIIAAVPTYTHPTEKQCSYLPDLSNINAAQLGGRPPSYYASAASVSAAGRYVVGVYAGNGQSAQTVTLGFAPKAVFAAYGGYAFSSPNNMAALAIKGHNVIITNGAGTFNGLLLTSTGFTVFENAEFRLNYDRNTYFYIAFK